MCLYFIYFFIVIVYRADFMTKSIVLPVAASVVSPVSSATLSPRHVLSALSLACLASHAAAAPVEGALPSLTFTTTATKTATPVKNTIAQTTVIDEEALQRFQGQSVLDVLRGQAGFYVTQSGGDGSMGSIRVRGYKNTDVLVLIDGIRYSSVSFGGSNLNLIPADQVDRIEILYGASGSSLYGADAMGGVIQVFTKGQNAQQSNTALTLGAGTQNSYKAQVSNQLVTNTSTISLSSGYEKTDGINATKNAIGANTDKDSFESKNVSLLVKHQLNDQVNMGITGLYAQSTTDYDSDSYDSNWDKTPFAQTYGDYKNGAVSGFVNYQNNQLTSTLKYGQSFDKSTSYDGTTPQGGTYDTKQNQANLQLTYQLPAGSLIGGVEHLKQSLTSNSTYSKDSRTIKSGFVGYQLYQPTYDFQAQLRTDDNSEYGNQTTYNIGAAYRILPDLRLGASYATGFKAPSFYDAFAVNPAWNYIGNPNLKAETSKNTEVFVEYSNALTTTRLTAYQSDINDRITTEKLANSSYSTTVNRNESEIKGLSLTSDWTLNNTLFGLNYTNQRIEDTNQGIVTEDASIAENIGLAYIGYKQPSFDIRAESQYTGKRVDGYTKAELDRYTLLNLSANYYMTPNLTINTRLNNLTGKEYETVYGYNQKGINAFVSATYKWF